MSAGGGHRSADGRRMPQVDLLFALRAFGVRGPSSVLERCQPLFSPEEGIE